MSKNKKSFLDSPIIIKTCIYLIIFCDIILIAIYSKTHDSSLPPFIFWSIVALILPEVIRIFKAYYALKKEQERERILNIQNAEKEAKRIAALKALVDKEFNEGKAQGKMVASANLSELQKEKEIQGRKKQMK